MLGRISIASSSILIAAILLHSTPVTGQTKGEIKKAEKLYSQGIKLYKKGDYAEAIISFKKAHELVPDVGNLYNIARCLHKMGRLEEAIEYYSQYIEQGGPKRKKAISYLEEIESIPATVVIRTIPEGGTVWIDGSFDPVGTAPITVELSPGKHIVTAEVPGHGFGKRNIYLSFSDKYTYTIKIKKSKSTVAASKKEPPALATKPLPKPPSHITKPVTTPAPQPAPKIEHKPGHEPPSGSATEVEEELDDSVAGHATAGQPSISLATETPSFYSNTLLVGGGIAFPIVFREVNAFVSVDLSWELGIGEHFGAGLGLDIQFAGNGQLYLPYAFGLLNLSLRKGLFLFVRGGIGAVIARAPVRSLIEADAAPWDLLLRLDGGLGWSTRGFHLRLDALGFHFLANAGNLVSKPSAQYVPRLLIGYCF